MDRSQKEKFLIKKLKFAIPLDNDVFAIFVKNKKFCEEFLRVILQDNELIVIDNEPQKFLPNAYFKGVYLDMLCKLGNGKIVNVEIQLYEEKDEAKRIFYYASMIEQAFVEKGTKYKDIKDIIVIYLTKDDIFHKGNSVYNVDMRVMTDRNEFVKPWNCGLQVKYVNTVGLTNENIKEYLQILSDKTTYDVRYPMTSEIKKDILENENGGSDMSVFHELVTDYYEEGMQKGRQEGRQEGIFTTLIKLVKDNLLDPKDAAKQINVTEEEFRKMMVEMPNT